MCRHCENVVGKFKGLDEFETMSFCGVEFAHLTRYKLPGGGFSWELTPLSIDEEDGWWSTVYFCPWCGRMLEREE